MYRILKKGTNWVSQNKHVYECPYIVNIYSKLSELQPPELALLKAMQGRLKFAKMLDIGIGTGRTTTHFLPCVKEYIGIDYSKNMVEVCKTKFPILNQNGSLRVCDVRSMQQFQDEEFDFILFSYNGLDYMSSSDRIITLKEINRLLKKNGVFAFSSHNIRYVNSLLSLKIDNNLIKLLKNIIIYLLRWFFIGKSNRYKNLKATLIRDGAGYFYLKTFYICPEEQIRQLNELKFSFVQTYLFDQELRKNPWIYYCCSK